MFPTLTSVTRRLAFLVGASALLTQPALAEPDALERVEVRGRIIEAPLRYDVHAACENFDEQFLKALSRTWVDDGRYGEVKVQFVLAGGEVDAVSTSGISISTSQKVRRAMQRVTCTAQPAVASAKVYRFSVDFVPFSERDPADGNRAVAVRRVRVNNGG